jgi:hypothetical protein
MLGKLFKYEWKSFWKVPAAINVFLLIITFIGAISLLSPFWELDFEIMDTLMVFAIMFYYLALMAGSIAIAVYIAIRFYKNVYTDEGYLTHTLPVSPRDIIFSKLFVSIIWSIITGIVICFSVFFLLFAAMKDYINTYELVNVWQEIKREALPVMEEAFGNLFVFVLFIILLMFITTVFSILMMYSAVSLGQMFSKHKVAGAVIWYVAEYVIVQFSSSILMNIPLLGVISDPYAIDSMTPAAAGTLIKLMLIGSAIISAIAGTLLYFLTEYMMRRKLNLD